MIVIGLDVHKQSVTAVAVDEAGRTVSRLARDRKTAPQSDSSKRQRCLSPARVGGASCPRVSG